MNIKDSIIFCAGGSGSWGKELCRQLIPLQPKKIIVFSRGEISQVEMQRSFRNKLIDFVIGDVRDRRSINYVFSENKIDYVFQLAALKHVPICENQPWEAILTNIYGTKNLIDESITAKVKKFIYVGTDKAVDPLNVYGLTKAIGEKLVIQANALTMDTDFICIRSGNVLGTNGSLVPYVINQIKTQNEVLLTSREMTRFFTTFTESVKFLLKIMETGQGGCVYIPKMPSFFISDTVDVLVEYYGNTETKIKEVGIREGEKIHEVLVSEHETGRTSVFSDRFVIYPQIETGRNYEYEKNGMRFSSADNLKDKYFLIDLFKSGGWLNGKCEIIGKVENPFVK